MGRVQLFMGDSIEVLSLQLFPASCEDSVNIKTGFQLINQSIKASSFFQRGNECIFRILVVHTIETLNCG